jgi:hypothetical protein
MPNIDFYAAGADFIAVLDYVFEKSQCRVFESYSRPGEDIIEFKSTGDLFARRSIGICKGSGHSVWLQLVPPSGLHRFKIRRIPPEPKICNGHTFRYAIDGWGLIQLYLGGIGPRGLVNSHSNHFSEAGARKWIDVRPQVGSLETWDFREITSISSAFNRFIRTKLAVYKLGSRPVLRGAADAFADGIDPIGAIHKSLLNELRAS